MSDDNALLLGRNSTLCEVMLQILDAPQRHHALPLRCTPAEWLGWLVGTAEIWVDRGLPSGLLRRRRRGRCAWGKLEHVRRLVHLRWRLRPILL